MPCGIARHTGSEMKLNIKEKTVSVYERLEAPNIALPKLTPPVMGA